MVVGRSVKSQSEETGVRRVDQPEAQALTRPHRDRLGRAAVEGYGVAHAAFAADIVPVTEVVADRAVVLQPPVRPAPRADRGRLSAPPPLSTISAP